MMMVNMKHCNVFCNVKKIHVSLLILSLVFTNNNDAQTELTLQGTWQCLDSLEINAPGRMPGSLYNALLSEGIIADPFVGTNEDSIQWVSQMDWTFTSHAFEASEVDLNSSFLEIDRVLTYSVWSINGVNIGTTDNAFHMWKFDLKSALKPTGNIVQINFESPHKRAKSIISNASHPLPGDALRAVHRSPQFAFGWDWAMSLLDNSVGSMNIEQSSTKHPLQIKKLDVITDRIESGTATGRVRWEIEGESDEKLMLRWALTNPEGQVVAAGKPKHGKGLVEVPFEIKNADLWWTHDLGTPAMHTLEVVAVGQGKLMGREKIEVGLRTLRLDTSEDKRGANFKWILNNVPLFAGGANVVPADLILNRIRPSEEIRLVENAVAANMNTLRVWGGGNYASDTFMNACDELGVLVWHDFMFACAMYPGDDEFIHSVSNEASYQTQRLRHHPSLAMWCGNNEVSEGWARWGWKDGLTSDEIADIQSSYDKVFEELLPSIVAEFDDAPYWSSSPSLGRGDSDFVKWGDAHDWGIWHDGYSFDSLWSRVPRFMSEFGFQSFPEKSTWETVVSDANFNRESEAVRAHEKHSRGFEIIDSYLDETHGSDFEDLPYEEWSYLTQVIQAKGISEGVKAARLNQDFCSGSLVWQLNDCWPVASWSSIDAHGKWKLLHHKLKTAFAPTLLYGRWNTEGRKPILEVGLVSNPTREESKEIPGTLRVSVVGFNGEEISVSEHPVTLSPGVPMWTEFENILSRKVDPTRSFIQLSWSDNACEDKSHCQHSASAVVWAVLPKDLNLDPADISVQNAPKLYTENNSTQYIIESPVFAKDVQLTCNASGNFNINGFDLLPGEKKIVVFTPHKLETWAPEFAKGGTSQKPYSQFLIQATSLNAILD